MSIVSFAKKRSKILFSVTVIIIAILIFVHFFLKTSMDSEEEITVAKSNFASTIMTTGKVTSENVISVKSEITATVISCNYNVGDSFLKDDILVKYEDSDLERLLQQTQLGLDTASNNLKTITDKELLDAEETVKQAKLEYEKTEEAFQENKILFEAGAISENEVDSAKYAVDISLSKLSTAENTRNALLPQGVKYNNALLNVKEAEIKLKDARASYEKTIINAPFEGVILKKYFEVGEIVEAGKEIFVIADNKDELYIKASIDEKYVSSLKTGQKVYIRTEAFEDIVIDGYISKIAPSVDSQKGTIDIEVKMDRIPEFLKRELSVNLEIVTQEFENVFVLDKKYVDFSSGTKVWVKGKNAIDVRDIEIIHDQGSRVIISDGIQEGEIITIPEIKS